MNNKSIVKGKIIVEYNFEGIEVPESFNWNEIDEAVRDAFKYDTGIDWDSGVIKEINYAPENEWGFIEDDEPREMDDWDYADMQYDAWKNGDYDEN